MTGFRLAFYKIVAFLFCFMGLHQSGISQAFFDSCLVEQVTDSLFPGQNEAKILAISVYVSGSASDSIKLKNFSFNTSGTSHPGKIKSAHLHYQGSNKALNQPLISKNLISSTNSPFGNFLFTDSIYIKSGLHYFILSFNISAAADTLNRFDAELSSISANGASVSPKTKSAHGHRAVAIVGDSIYCKNTRVFGGNYEVGPTQVQIGKHLNNYTNNSEFYSFFKEPIELKKSEKQELEIKSGPFFNEAMHAWIDWDGDGYFEPTEKILTDLNLTSGQKSISKIEVPCTIMAGHKRLRIIGEFNTSSIKNSCASVGYGTVEDYVLKVLPEDTPQASFITDSSAFANGVLALKNNSTFSAVNTVFEWDIDNNGVLDTLAYNLDAKLGSGTIQTIVLKASSKTCDSSQTLTSTFKADIKLITPKNAPQSAFISNKNLCKTGETVTLTDISSNGPTGWEWSILPNKINGKATHKFIEGTSRISKNPKIVFNTDGRYTVVLKVGNNKGSDKTAKTHYITIQPDFEMCGNFGSGIDTITANKGVITDNGGRDGNYANNLNCSVLIRPKCAEQVFLDLDFVDISKWITSGNSGDFFKIYDGDSEKDSALHQSIGYSKGIYSINGVPTKFGRLTARSGSMLVKFSSDASINTQGFVANFSIKPKKVKAPIARITAPDTVYINSPVTFSCNKKGAWIDKIWDLDGDGLPDAFGNEVTYRFKAVGTYNVGLVMNACGQTDSAQKTITVIVPNARPNVNFETPFAIVCPADTVFLFDKSSNGATQFRWRFNRPKAFQFEKGTNNRSRNPIITFDSLGIYSIGLWAQNGMGADSIYKNAFIEVRNYCEPLVVSKIGNLGITKVTVKNLNGNTVLEKSSRENTGFANYTKNHKFSGIKGEPFTITIERADTIYNMQRAVWIDFNLDGVFSNAEKVLSEKAQKSLTYTDTFYIDSASATGLSRIRVAANTAGKTDYGCGPHLAGEFEDYGLIIKDDDIRPTLTLIGPDTLFIEKCKTYAEPGYHATDNIDGSITNEVNIKGSIDTYLKGTQSIVYSVKDKNNNYAFATRTVVIGADTTGPELTLMGKAIDTIDVFSTYADPGVDTFDFCSGIDTVYSFKNINTNKVGTYSITYWGRDLVGNIDSNSRTVVIVDVVKPVFKFKPNADTVSMEVHTAYLDTGWIATDNYDKKPYVIWFGVIDTSTVDTFKIYYLTSDSSGNSSAISTRTIIVEDKTAPVLKLPFDTIEIEVGRRVNLPEALVSDNYDLEPIVELEGSFDKDVIGNYAIKYYATDGFGNVSDTAWLIVNIVDHIAPKAKLNGAPFVQTCRWGSYTELGISVSDNYNDSSTLSTSTVYLNKLDEEIDVATMLQSNGYYTALYIVYDESNNSTQATRIIEVYECNPLSVSQKRNTDNWALYPNPGSAHNEVIVTYEHKKQATLSIYTMEAKELIYTQNIVSGTYILPKLKAGIYFVSLKNKHFSSTQKLVIID